MVSENKSENTSLRIKIVYVAKIHDIVVILCTSLTSKMF